VVQDDLEMLWILSIETEIAETNWIYQVGKLNRNLKSWLDILNMEKPQPMGFFPAF
jgi:hypothetical protein